MSRLERAQLHIHTLAGELVTSTRLTFDGVTNEYVTLESLFFLIGGDNEDYHSILKRYTLIMREKNGQQWVNCSDLMPLFGWTSG